MHLIRVHLHVIFHGIHMSEPAPRLPCTSALVTKVFMSNTKLQTKYYLEEIFADGDPSIHSRKINSNSLPYHLKFNHDETLCQNQEQTYLIPHTRRKIARIEKLCFNITIAMDEPGIW